jgi:DNA-binding protein HU-beta
MNKVGFIERYAEKTGNTKKDSDIAITAVFDVIMETLASGEEINLIGTGKFSVTERPEHSGINPKTKEPILISKSKRVSFKAGKTFKDFINK